MIHLTRSRNPGDIHAAFHGAKLQAKLVKLAKARHEQGANMEFKGAIGDWKKAKPQLAIESFAKCAYCEAFTAVVAHGDVEHFRPKSIYWWLALCVDNFVFACQICNQSYKSNTFPIYGKVLTGPKLPISFPTTKAATAALGISISPDPVTVVEAALRKSWLAEVPGLPHPYIDDPEPLFAWSAVETACEVHLVVPKRATPRARRAVKCAVACLGLNREQLLKLRYIEYEKLVFALNVWKDSKGKRRATAESHVRAFCRNDRAFAGMCRHFSRLAGFPV